MAAIKATVIVLRCLSCGFKRTQSPPAPERCPRCSELVTPPRDRFELALDGAAPIHPAVGRSPLPPEQLHVSESVDGRVFDER